MRFMSKKRPSPAMVVAVVALSLGLAGSAVAAKGGLGKAQVKTVANKQITKRAPGLAVASATSADTAKTADTAKSADTATSADTAKTADTAKSADTASRATNVYGAQVDSTGVLLGSIPGGVTSTRINNGQYRVDFPRAVEGCLIFSAGGSNDTAISGSTSVSPRTDEHPNRLVVVTLNSAGTVADRDFYVQITCP